MVFDFLLVPYPFFATATATATATVRRNPPTTMQAADRPRSVVKGPRVPGAGAGGRRGRLRLYPECTQKLYPHCPSPPAQNSALTISYSLNACRAYLQASTLNKKIIHYQPRPRRRGPTQRDGTKQPTHPVSASAASPPACYLQLVPRQVLTSARCCTQVGWEGGSPGRLGGHAHPSCWVPPSPLHWPSTQALSLNPPTTLPVTPKRVHPTCCYSTASISS